MQCGKRHKELDKQGKGLCSVPMWCQGVPAGFCDNEAYGHRENKRVYDGYVMHLACPGHGGPKIRVCMDGNQFCATRPDFINLQESPAGFGNTREESIKDLETQNGHR